MNKNNTYPPEDLFAIAKILKPKGLNGEMKVFLYNKDSDILNENIYFWIKENNIFTCYDIESINQSSKYYLVRLKGIINREQAELISNRKLYVSRKDLSNKKGYYLIDLIGFLVKDEFGNDYGKVIDVINLPTNNSLLIDYHNREIMVPIIDNFIELFDYKDEVIVIKNSDVFIKQC